MNLIFKFIFVFFISTHTSYALERSIYLAGGCFWCMEEPFEKLKGVKRVVSGFSGGKKIKPKYKEVASGKTNHIETVKIVYDSDFVSLKQILDIYWLQINPCDNAGQFVDRGPQYRPAIFYNNSSELKIINKYINFLNKENIFNCKIKTDILKFNKFYSASKDHQDFYKNNFLKYKYYRYQSGRDEYLKKQWTVDKIKKFFENSKAVLPDNILKKALSKIQYNVTQKNDTEKPFKNKYWNNKSEGIYIDIITKKPLFYSFDKFKSGTGWPSFTRPINKNSIIEIEDNSFGMKRIEVRSRSSNSHLGHVFTDGPSPLGLRYCINSAALEFIPKQELKTRGYSKFFSLFKGK